MKRNKWLRILLVAYLMVLITFMVSMDTFHSDTLTVILVITFFQYVLLLIFSYLYQKTNGDMSDYLRKSDAFIGTHFPITTAFALFLLYGRITDMLTLPFLFGSIFILSLWLITFVFFLVFQEKKEEGINVKDSASSY